MIKLIRTTRKPPLRTRRALQFANKDELLAAGKETQGKRTDILSTVDKMLEPHDTRAPIHATARSPIHPSHYPPEICEAIQGILAALYPAGC